MEHEIRNDLQSAPARPRWFFIIRSTIVFSFLFSLFVLFLAYEIFLPHTNFYGERRIEIPEGYGSRKIGGILRDEGVIQSKWAFVVYATLKNNAYDLKPGTYVFRKFSYPANFGELGAGRGVPQRKISRNSRGLEFARHRVLSRAQWHRPSGGAVGDRWVSGGGLYESARFAAAQRFFEGV